MAKIAGFTDRFISNLKPEAKEYWKREGRGFTIRVLPSGEKTWYFIYTFEGRKRYMKLGVYPDVSLANARDKFDDARKKVSNGIDPIAEKEQAAEDRKKAPTVKELIEEYIKKHAEPSKRSWKEDQRILNKDALVLWGKRKAADIKKRDVVLLLEGIVERGSPGSANNNFKIIRKMFRFAVQRDILEHSPCDGVIMPAPVNRGERVLTETEIKTMWENLGQCPISADIQKAIKLILLTGQRPGEVIGMHTAEIDGDWWTIPADRSKNGKPHHVFLTKKAKDLILESIDSVKRARELPAEQEYKGFIFPCPHVKKIQPIGRLAISQAIGRSLAVPVLVNSQPVFDKGGNPVTENKLGIADFVPHDLRRTAATFLSKLGFMDEIVDAVLNHTKRGVIRTYNLHRYDREIQQALEAWERKLNSIITGKQGKVIPIQSGKAV